MGSGRSSEVLADGSFSFESEKLHGLRCITSCNWYDGC